ncbi:MAG: excinuclease ABC subunit C, partial [candidate division WOR-3 bacterium]|nr:excinuclease ABC subunit C [candidate division WOR-3 bacterium]
NILRLPGTPGLIGGVDISHFSGKWTAGAVVLFKNGKPLKSGYRYYKLDYIGNDDYRAISHILGRYIEKYPLDMVLIDGGKGQLKAARRAIEDMDKNIAVFSLAKRPDQVYASDYSKVMIPAKSPAFKLIKEIRDEAHRFANKLRKKQMKIE